MAFYSYFILLLSFCLSHMCCCHGSYIIQKQKDPSKAHQIKLEMIVKALKWLQMEMDLDEVECIMSILIYKNLVKGYFAHKSKVAVLSKQDPFPKLNGKPINT
ncbi:putative winged helix-like DNA-binding domain superfamily [Helianthus anomalus]